MLGAPLDFGVRDTSVTSSLCLYVNDDTHFNNRFSMEEKLLCFKMSRFFFFERVHPSV